MKTEHIANLVLVIVLVAAILGMYYAFKPAGKAYQMTDIQMDTVGECCCTDKGQVFKVPSEKLASLLLPSDCAATCAERGSQSLGQC